WQLNYPNDQAPTQTVPFVYDTREVEFNALVTRRFGTSWKLDVTGGIGAYTLRYTAPAETPLPSAVSDWYTANWVPRSEDAAHLYGLISLFKPDYAVEHDLE